MTTRLLTHQNLAFSRLKSLFGEQESRQANDMLIHVMIIYKCFCIACEFEMKVVSASNTCRILVFHNALTVKPLWISSRIMKQNHAEKRCHLRQVTVCFESCYGVISVKQHGKVTEITG